MPQHLKHCAPERVREKRRAAAARYFEMEPAELEKLLRDPKELRRAIVFVMAAMKIMLGNRIGGA
jgi:hypothetical protein